MSDCNVCKKVVAATRQNVSITCSNCNKQCHSSCVSMTKEDVECIVSQNKVWRCPPCSKARKDSMSNTPDKGKPDICQIINMLKEERKNIELEMNKAFDFVHKQIDDQKALLKDQNNQLAEAIKAMEQLQEENKPLRVELKKLHTKQDDIQQYSRANTVEKHNIPELPNEDAYEIVSKVGQALDMEISRDMIDICHRLGRKDESGRPAPIIAKLVRREVKQTMLSKRRTKKKDFTVDHVGYKTSSVFKIVYINESLCPGRRRVYEAARDVKRNKGFKYLWIRNGKILMRGDDNAPVTTLQSMDDVDCL